jgi:hypothetical protein
MGDGWKSTIEESREQTNLIIFTSRMNDSGIQRAHRAKINFERGGLIRFLNDVEEIGDSIVSRIFAKVSLMLVLRSI